MLVEKERLLLWNIKRRNEKKKNMRITSVYRAYVCDAIVGTVMRKILGGDIFVKNPKAL